LGYNISNNQAEYRGLINGLDYMARQDMTCNSLYVRGDSKLVIRQMEGKYQVKSNNIKPYYNEAQESLERLDCARTTFKFVPRERNCVADELANEAIQNG
jgi:ribonuclease HI